MFLYDSPVLHSDTTVRTKVEKTSATTPIAADALLYTQPRRYPISTCSVTPITKLAAGNDRNSTGSTSSSAPLSEFAIINAMENRPHEARLKAETLLKSGGKSGLRSHPQTLSYIERPRVSGRNIHAVDSFAQRLKLGQSNLTNTKEVAPICYSRWEDRMNACNLVSELVTAASCLEHISDVETSSLLSRAISFMKEIVPEDHSPLSAEIRAQVVSMLT